MNRGDISSVQEIKDLSQILNKNKYYSILLTYHSKNKDFLIKSFKAASNKENLKYMIAIRTYAITPEYMAMICKSYNEEFPGKLILNIVSGDLHKDESSIKDLLYISELVDTPEKRLSYTKKWVEKFNEITNGYTPEIFMSGHSDETRTMANQFDATHISMLDMYKEYLKKTNRIVNKKQMISLSILIRDSKKEAEDFIRNNANGNGLGWTLYGTQKEVISQIKDLENFGVTDIIIAKIDNDEKEHLIHEIIRSLT